MSYKKLVTLLMCFVIAATCCVTLAGCNNNQLSTPANLSVNDKLVISWDAVEGAERYMLAFNSNASTQFMTQNTSFDLMSAGKEIENQLQSGKTNSVTVRAVNIKQQDGKMIPINMSQWAEQVTFFYTKQASTVSSISYNAENYTLTWRKSTISGAVYVLGVFEEGSTEPLKEVSLKDYTLTPNIITGDIALDITDILATLEAKSYQVALKVQADGYEDSVYSKFVNVDLTSGVPGGGTVDPDPDPEPEPEPDPDPNPEKGSLVSITAFYTGPQLEVGTSLLDSAYVMVVASYDNDVTDRVYGFTTDIKNHSGSAGTKTITVSYTEGDVTVTTTISITFVDDASDPANPDDQPDTSAYKLIGIDGNTSGVGYTTLTNGSYLWRGVIVDGNDNLAITYGDDTFAFDVLENATEVSATEDSNGYIVLPDGEYDIYFNLETKTITALKIVYSTYYYYNTDGWTSVYAYGWTEQMTKVTPQVGDYVIIGDMFGEETAWTAENSVKLFESTDPSGNTQYGFAGLSLTAGTKLKIAQLGETTHTYYNKLESGVTSTLYTIDEEGNIVIAQDGIYDFYFKSGTKELYFGKGTSESTPNMETTSVTVTNAWPGNKMTAVEGHEGWYSVTVRGTIDKIIFNNGSSGTGNQTADLTVEKENVYYKDGKWQASF